MRAESTKAPTTILPVWTPGSFSIAGRSDLDNLLDMKPGIFTTRGAVALTLSLRLARIGYGDEVLLPAFHCPSMVEPIVAAGAKPVFYGITEELGANLTSIKALISSATRAILVPHLFGRIQDLREVADLCRSVGAVLIEDCAHSLTAAVTGPKLGAAGDYVIASPRKFLPVGEGGFLSGIRLNQQGLPSTGRPPFMRNIRLAFDLVDRAVATGRLSILRGAVAGAKRLKPKPSSAEASAPTTSSGDFQLGRELQAMQGASAFTRLLIRHWDLDHVARARRQRYGELEKIVGSTHDYRTIDSSLPLSKAPYMLPVLLSDPATQFPLIKRSRVPVWRWEHSKRGVCKVTDYYADALIQMPCHESLSQDDMYCIGELLGGRTA